MIQAVCLIHCKYFFKIWCHPILINAKYIRESFWLFVFFRAGEHGNFTLFLASFQGGNPFTSLLRNLACLFSYIFSGLSKNVNNSFFGHKEK